MKEIADTCAVTPMTIYRRIRTSNRKGLSANGYTNTTQPPRWQGFGFFALMHSCGLRTGEVLGLASGDVNLGEGTISIRWSKGNRSRQLPITSEIIKVLEDCDRVSRETFGKERAAFFVSTLGTPVRREAIGDVFHRIWDQAGLLRPLEGKSPTPYAFRH